MAESYASAPDVVRADRPSLLRCFAYARWGEQHPPTGPGRAFSVAMSVVLLPFVAAGYLFAWSFERPARAVGVVAFVFALAHLPYAHDALALAGRVLTWPLSIGF